MLTQSEILKLLVGLREVNDLDLVASDMVLESCGIQADRKTVCELAAVINEIYTDFNYESSPEFFEKITGKSEQVQNMHRKLLNPARRQQKQKELGESLVRIPYSDDAFRLVAADQHHRLDHLRSLVNSITDSSK